MKKALYLLLTLAIMLVSMSVMCFAEVDEVHVKLDGEVITFDQAPIIVNGRTLVPVRAIFEGLGATIEWDDSTKTVTSKKGNTTIVLKIGSTTMTKNGTNITLDVAPQIVSSRTLVPIRAISESFGCTVEWDGDIKMVRVFSAGYTKPDEGTQKVYHRDGRTKTIDASYAEDYLRSGWFPDNKVTMFARGTAVEVSVTDIDEYEADGWYLTPEEAFAAGGAGAPSDANAVAPGALPRQDGGNSNSGGARPRPQGIFGSFN